MDEIFRECRICEEIRPITSFGVCKVRKSGKRYRRRECNMCYRERHKIWRDQNREHVRERGRLTMMRLRNSGTEEERTARRAKAARIQVERRARFKDLVYGAYGGYRCSCCGETEPLFLSVDHVNNDGYERRKAGEGVSGVLWKKIIDAGFPPDYQVLCMNCNHGKSRNGGICPHQDARKVRRLSPEGE